MKQINNYILEKLHLSKDTKSFYHYYPKNKKELISILNKLIEERGQDADLNDINTYNVTNMDYLFEKFREKIRNINISKWDVSNVKSMNSMFQDCRDFNCNLSEWNVNKVTNMEFMFFNCEYFDSDLKNWNVHNVINMDAMFCGCVKFKGDGLDNWKIDKVINTSMMFDDCKNFNCDLSKWDVSKVVHMFKMFSGCEKFNCDLNNWKLNPKLIDGGDMFKDTPLENNPPKWYETD